MHSDDLLDVADELLVTFGQVFFYLGSVTFETLFKSGRELNTTNL
jgi:hypothetical protein